MGFREVATIEDVCAFTIDIPLKVDKNGIAHPTQVPVRVHLIRPSTSSVVMDAIVGSVGYSWRAHPAEGHIVGPVRFEADGPCDVTVSSRSGEQRFRVPADEADAIHQ